MSTPNCFVIMNTQEPSVAIDRAAEWLAAYVDEDTAEWLRAGNRPRLYRAPEVVPASWGYPPRVVVTFATEVRDWQKHQQPDGQ